MTRAYTRYIKTLRLLLPTLAALGLLSLLIWPWWRERQQQRLQEASPAPVITTSAPTTRSPLQVIKPEYQGTDRSGRPFRITAARVEQALDPKDPLLLIEPQATMALGSSGKTEAVLKATHGTYDPQAQTIDLKGDVTFDYAGYQLQAADLAVDLLGGAAATATPVQGEGPAGTLSGQSLSIADKGALIVLKGPSRLILHPPRPDKTPTAPATP